MEGIHSGAFLCPFLFCVHFVLQRKRSEALILSGGSWGSVPFEKQIILKFNGLQG